MNNRNDCLGKKRRGVNKIALFLCSLYLLLGAECLVRECGQYEIREAAAVASDDQYQDLAA